MARIDNDDPATRQAVEILVEALTQQQLRGVLEMRQCVDALRRYLDDPKPETAEFASRVFNSIDVNLRRVVADVALETARVHIGKPTPPAPAAKKPKEQETVGGWRGLFGR